MPEIVYRKTVDLNELYHNPRFIRDYDFESLCTSIKNNPEHFEARPLILSDRTGLLVVIAGNMRLKAAVHNGQKEVPTILLSGLTEAKEQEIIIRDNVNNGSWDYDQLANEWDKNQLMEWGVPAMWDLVDEEPEPEVSDKPSIAKLTIEFADFVQLGQARTEIEELLRSYEGAEIK
jgi:hypothetical protein